MASEQIREDLVEEIVRRYKDILAGLAKYQHTRRSNIELGLRQ